MKDLMRKFFDITFWKFILVGIANTLFGTAIMFGFYNLAHFNYWVSSAANYIFGSILSYFLNKHFTFKNQDRNPSIIVKFVVNISICYLLAYGLAKPIIGIILSNRSQVVRDNISMLVGMGVFVIFNYIGQRFWTFKENKDC